MSHPITFQDRVRATAGGVVNGAGAALHRLGVHPDVVTVAGLVVVLIAAVFIARGQFPLAGVILVLGLPLDAVDGAVARAMGRKDRRGAVLDSTLDRYADGILFSGFVYYFAARDALDYMLLALVVLVASFVVSYVRARAGEAGLAVRVGLLDRLVRMLILIVALLIPALLVPALWIMALGGVFTGLQRLWYVYSHLDREV